MLPTRLLQLLRPALILGMAALLAPTASAGDLQLGLTLGGKHGKVAVHLGHGHGGVVIGGKLGHGYGPPVVRGCRSHTRCVPSRRWVPGHHETVERKVWIPETKEKVWVPPRYQMRYDSCGRPYQVLVHPGEWTVVCHPGHFETRCERVWVPGGYSTSCSVY